MSVVTVYKSKHCKHSNNCTSIDHSNCQFRKHAKKEVFFFFFKKVVDKIRNLYSSAKTTKQTGLIYSP